MRNLFLTTIALTALTSAAYAKNLTVAIPASIAEAPLRKTVQSTVNQMQPGDSVDYFDAYDLHHICSISLPEKDGYKHPKAKMRVGASCIKKLIQHIDNDQTDHKIKLPQFLRFIGENHIASDQEHDVIIIGNPLYLSGDAFDMSDSKVPGDGHLRNSVSSTVFGIDNPELLKNIRLHIGYPKKFAAHDQHRWHVKRFWTLFVEEQSGELVSFTGDLSTLLNRVEQNAHTPKHSYERQDTPRLEMIQLAPVELKETRSIFQRPVEKSSLSPSDMKAARDVQIGITWDCTQCDLDLHVRPHASAEVLSFRRTQTEEGRYWKDFTNAPAHGFETIDLSGVTDLRDLLIAVNFYSGETASPLTGEIRLAVGDKTYAKAFIINASSGNNGKGADTIWRNRKSSFPEWIIIDPKLVVSTSK